MRELRQLDQLIRNIWVRYEASTECELNPFVPTMPALEEVAGEVRDGLARLRDASDSVAPRSAYSAHAAQLLDVMEVMEARLTDDPTFPNRYAQRISSRLGSLLGLDRRGVAERTTAMRALLSAAPSVLAAAGELAARSPEDRRELFAGAVDSLTSQLTQLPSQLQTAMSGADATELESLGSLALEAAEAARGSVRELRATPRCGPGEQLPQLSYEETLRRIYGIELEDLLAWYRDEVESCDREFRALAHTLGPGRDPFAILIEDSPAYGTPDEMYTAIAGFLQTARARTLEYITLPQGEVCEVKQVPEHLRHSYPWGGYWGGDTLRGDLVGAVFLNRYNYREITRAWIQMNAVHESYPGHHAHAVKTAAGDMPMAFKLAGLTSRGAPLSEGIAHRSETLLKDVFGEPAYELFILYRRLHTATRIWADLELFHLGGGVEAAVALYRKYLGFADQVARGQVLSQRLTPGYFTVYYYGMRDLERLQKEIGWDDKSFTELIFSSGKLSLKVLRLLIELDGAERAGLMTRYSNTG